MTGILITTLAFVIFPVLLPPPSDVVTDAIYGFGYSSIFIALSLYWVGGIIFIISLSCLNGIFRINSKEDDKFSKIKTKKQYELAKKRESKKDRIPEHKPNKVLKYTAILISLALALKVSLSLVDDSTSEALACISDMFSSSNSQLVYSELSGYAMSITPAPRNGYPYIDTHQEPDGRVHFQRNDIDKIQEYGKYKMYFYPHSRLCVKFEELDFTKGLNLYRNEKYKESLIIFDREIEQNPSEQIPYIAKAASLIKLERYEEALEWLDKAEEIDENWVEIYKLKCYPLLGLGKIEEAHSTIERLIRINEYSKLRPYIFSSPDIEWSMREFREFADMIKDVTIREEVINMLESIKI
ncbi:tetratricopeptide (TPR) repeat protein [Anaerosolibacter carboniphilus]|uniref:Tetratricopeptide (TPR) repeat protein n=1 Tax=Anaerosolibacter carboniphilus TaxID=1417629 RepID=A0A841KUW8_9FIRM|nr:hypothetical protein [Anaerosolibacter carboniphilus]MBB6215988.1 tetratricopeptide (TPR) repeat protein [Anaerosolibacter carboniphilus]